uniref:Uncharacterized protein n=1 Tax=Amphimedon queenslandica TaxID=400682 RepID=A0A1X7UC86_AMPQE
ILILLFIIIKYILILYLDLEEVRLLAVVGMY